MPTHYNQTQLLLLWKRNGTLYLNPHPFQQEKKANRARNYLQVMGQFDVGIHRPLKTKINQNQLQ